MKCLNVHTKIRGIRVFDTSYLVILIYIYIYYMLFCYFVFLFFYLILLRNFLTLNINELF